jgi:hypothetical protein
MTFAASTAREGEEEPSWKMRRVRSSGWVVKISRPVGLWKEMTPVVAVGGCGG